MYKIKTKYCLRKLISRFYDLCMRKIKTYLKNSICANTPAETAVSFLAGTGAKNAALSRREVPAVPAQSRGYIIYNHQDKDAFFTTSAFSILVIG